MKWHWVINVAYYWKIISCAHWGKNAIIPVPSLIAVRFLLSPTGVSISLSYKVSPLNLNTNTQNTNPIKYYDKNYEKNTNSNWVVLKTIFKRWVIGSCPGNLYWKNESLCVLYFFNVRVLEDGKHKERIRRSKGKIRDCITILKCTCLISISFYLKKIK